MKNILIINKRNHTKIGGIETYCKELINILIKNNFKVFEFSENNFDSKITKKNYVLIKNKIFNKINFKNKLINNFLYTLKLNKYINKIIKQNKIDVVIQNNFIFPVLKFKKNVKYIWIQHSDWPFYLSEKNKFKFWLKKIFNLKNNFSYPNIVVFNKIDKFFLKSNKIVKEKINVVPISTSLNNLSNFSDLEERERESCFYW
ncbi:glycosyltransferase [Mycoplasmoides pirum]|uniref:glycosyltransferase n=1 Tax=Mycoplasmoides pirum TaxID=2122 RepID=UPI000488612A|nr:glycosyltransferase [Mycoplasmoides pirum]